LERAGEWSPNGPENRGVRKDRGSIPQRSANSNLLRQFNCGTFWPMTWFDWALVIVDIYMVGLWLTADKSPER